MSITVIDAAPDKLLTTLDNIKLNLSIDDNSKDEMLTDIIRQSSDWIKSYTGRDFSRETVKETIVGKGLPTILLSRTPIVSLDTVTRKGSIVDNVEIYDKESGILQLVPGFTSGELSWNTIDRHPSPYGEKNFEVTYVGGYVLPNWNVTDLDRDLPFDLERACIELVKTTFKQINIDGSWRSYKVGDTQVVWDRSQRSSGSGLPVIDIGLPSIASNILNFYRRAF